MSRKHRSKRKTPASKLPNSPAGVHQSVLVSTVQQAPSTRPRWFDAARSSDRVARALREAGVEPWLIGFEAVGIQEFIAANGRPVAMEGASMRVEYFDRTNVDGANAAGTVFAGGGRGLKVVPREQLESVTEALQRSYKEATGGGQLAIAQVPFDRADQASSLRWLRVRLDGAKDAARPPQVPLPASATEKCADCKTRKASMVGYQGAEGLVQSCERCALVVEAGRSSGAVRWTLEEISRDGMIAVVSADGNNLGAVFANLDTLEENAICSDLIFGICKRAHDAACPADRRFVAPVVGGDDFRVFLPPEHLLPYVMTLAREVEQLSRDVLLQELPPRIARALPSLGIGVGAVVAPYHYPAARLLEMAHELEDSAKRASLMYRYNSAFDFVWLKSGDELSQGLRSVAKTARRPDALSLVGGAMGEQMARAQAITKVPSSQRAIMVGAQADLDEREFMNWFCYQVARSKRWQAWFEECNLDWREPNTVSDNVPNARLLDIASLMEMQQ